MDSAPCWSFDVTQSGKAWCIDLANSRATVSLTSERRHVRGGATRSDIPSCGTFETLEHVDDASPYKTVTVSVVMEPAGLEQVSSLVVREQRERIGVSLEIRGQIDRGQAEIRSQGQYAFVIRRISITHC